MTHASVKTQWRGGRMTSEYPAGEQVPWRLFKHTRTQGHIYTHLWMYTCKALLLRFRSASVTRAHKHAEHFLTRNNAGCPEETVELEHYVGDDEPMVGQEIGML